MAEYGLAELADRYGLAELAEYGLAEHELAELAEYGRVGRVRLTELAECEQA